MMHRRGISIVLLSVVFFAMFPILRSSPSRATMVAINEKRNNYLGFDLNEYPGDAALPVLRKTFSFTSYWLGPPPGEKQSTWTGKRAFLRSQGFGFIVLFNGPESRALKNATLARRRGSTDGQVAATLAKREGFEQGTIIFLDIEEGGRLPAAYHVYLKSWAETLSRAGYRTGVYCSGIPVSEGQGVSITTATNIQDNAGTREIVFWVFNDVCPPSPGCSFPTDVPSPAQSGFAAAVWQYAQSPRRKERTLQCPANYAADGNCYAPGDSGHKWFLDVNAASTRDPSGPK
jgi:hypothetical protein